MIHPQLSIIFTKKPYFLSHRFIFTAYTIHLVNNLINYILVTKVRLLRVYRVKSHNKNKPIRAIISRN